MPSTSSSQPGIIILGHKFRSRPAWFDAAKERDLPVYYFREEHTWESERAEEIIPITPQGQDNVAEVVSAAAELAARRSIVGVVAFQDAALAAWAAVASKLDLPGPDPALVQILEDKSLQRQAFTQAELPSARSIRVTSPEEILAAAEEIGFPVVLKPSNGAGSWGVIRVDNVSQLEQAIAPMTKVAQTLYAHVLVEEYLVGGEIAVDAISWEGQVLWQAAVEKPQPMEGPYFAELEMVSPANLPKETLDEVYSINARVVGSLNFPNGVTHTEYRITKDGPRLIETHARPGGQHVHWLFKTSSNVDTVGAVIDCAIGKKPVVSPQKTCYAGYRVIDPPKGGGIFRGVAGVEAARAIPRVENVLIAAKRGDVLFSVPESTQTSVAYVFATGESYDVVRAATAEAESKLTVLIDPVQVS